MARQQISASRTIRQGAASARKEAGKWNKSKSDPAAVMPARRTTKDGKNQEDQEAQAEAQREEEAIRAMWAADREATARVALSSTGPQQVFAMSSVGGRASNVSTERAHSPRRNQDESPISTQDSDNDLLASLELQLEMDSRSKDEKHRGFDLDLSHSLTNTSGRYELKKRGSAPANGGYAQERSQIPASLINIGERIQHRWQHHGGSSLSPSFVPGQREAVVPGKMAHQRPLKTDCRQVPPPEERVVYATAEPWGPQPHSEEHPGSLAQYSDMQPFDELSRPLPPPYARRAYGRLLVRDPRGDEHYIERPLSMKSPLISQEDTEPRFHERRMFRYCEQGAHQHFARHQEERSIAYAADARVSTSRTSCN